MSASTADEEKYSTCGKCSNPHVRKLDMMQTSCYHFICWSCFRDSDRVHCPRCHQIVNWYKRCNECTVYSCRNTKCSASFTSSARRGNHEQDYCRVGDPKSRHHLATVSQKVKDGVTATQSTVAPPLSYSSASNSSSSPFVFQSDF